MNCSSRLKLHTLIRPPTDRTHVSASPLTTTIQLGDHSRVCSLLLTHLFNIAHISQFTGIMVWGRVDFTEGLTDTNRAGPR